MEDLSYEPWQLRPANEDWAVICEDKRKTELSCGIIIPIVTNHERLHEGSGYIIRLNSGPIAKAERLKPGCRILYRSYLKYIHQLETTKHHPTGEPCEYFLISLKDVLTELDPGVEVGLLSERKL